jgi:hypothetical protein
VEYQATLAVLSFLRASGSFDSDLPNLPPAVEMAVTRIHRDFSFEWTNNPGAVLPAASADVP